MGKRENRALSLFAPCATRPTGNVGNAGKSVDFSEANAARFRSVFGVPKIRMANAARIRSVFWLPEIRMDSRLSRARDGLSPFPALALRFFEFRGFHLRAAFLRFPPLFRIAGVSNGISLGFPTGSRAFSSAFGVFRETPATSFSLPAFPKFLVAALFCLGIRSLVGIRDPDSRAEKSRNALSR